MRSLCDSFCSLRMAVTVFSKVAILFWGACIYMAENEAMRQTRGKFGGFKDLGAKTSENVR